MALVSRSGSKKPISSYNVATKETNLLAPDNILDANDRQVDKLSHIEDTFTTRHSVNPVSYPEEFHMLMAYPQGTPVYVTYFFQNLPDEDHESAMSDMSLVEHHGHKDLTEVRKLEIRLLSPIEKNFVEEDNTWDMSLEAIMYPGKDPHMGDILLIETGNNKFIQFQVNNVIPTTYRQGSYFRITANSTSFASAESIDKLRNCVTDVYYFDKDKYFADGRVTTLTHDSYFNLRKLEKYRKEIIEVYMNKFYREDFESVAYFDDTYDPYLVEYLKHKISLDDYYRRPEQLDTTLIDYDKSIWYKLAGSVCPDVWDDIYTFYEFKYYQANPLSPTNNRLDNSYKLTLVENLSDSSSSTINGNNSTYKKKEAWKCTCCKPTELYTGKKYSDITNTNNDNSSSVNNSGSYAFTSSFYNGITTDMDKYELLIYNYITGNKLNIPEAIEIIGSYRKLSDEKKYYILPALLAVIDWLIIALK